MTMAGKGKPGAPSKFSTVKAAKIIDALKEGMFRVHAAQLVGVSERTMKRWVARGRDNLREIDDWQDLADAGESEGPEPKLNRWGKFVIDVSIAEAAAERDALLAVQSAGAEDWRAAAWYLERKHARRYGSAALRLDLPSEEDMADDDMPEVEAKFLAQIELISTRVEKVKGGGG